LVDFTPSPDTEYRLVRRFRGASHLISYQRYTDDSGVIRHGNSLSGWEFDPSIWKADWERLRAAGWRVLDDAVNDGTLSEDSLPDCTNCDCQIPDITPFLEQRQAAGVPLNQINQEWQQYCKPFAESKNHLLWGGG
jgi:hypothetical protein